MLFKVEFGDKRRSEKLISAKSKSDAVQTAVVLFRKVKGGFVVSKK